MKIALALICIGLGAFAGELLTRVSITHEVAGRLFHRGQLIAVIQGNGIFEVDDHVLRANKQSRADEQSVGEDETWTTRRQLMAIARLQIAAQDLRGNRAELERDLAALQSQFLEPAKFRAALRVSGISEGAVKRMLISAARGEQWLEDQIRVRIAVSRDEAQQYFDRHPVKFMEPPRLHARHIFLAAPEGSPPELIEAKRRATQDLVSRLSRGEDFVQLAAVTSEDEATKNRGGDLGFLAANRIPSEFFSAVEKLPANSPAVLVQTHLGFHVVQIVEVSPGRAMTSEEVLPEITAQISAEKRRNAVDEIQSRLAQGGRFDATRM
jgi:parvulin-like peptidyl-prolyl isomerase